MTSDLDAGPDLDLLVATHVFRWDIWHPQGIPAIWEMADPDLRDTDYQGAFVRIPRYSTDLAATWLIVEHFGPQSLDWLIYRGDRYYAKIKGHVGDGATPSLAICWAALAAAGQPTSSPVLVPDPLSE